MRIDAPNRLPENEYMSIQAPISTELLERMHAAVERAAAGRRDPAQMRAACEEMDRIRESIQRRLGVIDLAVELIRDARNP
jgi:hypothetical protein